MKRCTSLFVLAAALLLTACTGYKVKYDFDSRASFTTYKTFDWYAASKHAKGKTQGVENALMDRRVRYAVEKELGTKGFRLEAKADPDFLVTYYPIYETRRYKTTTGFVGWGWGFRPIHMGGRATTTQVHSYREGTIVLEVVDFKTNELVWQAAAEGALNAVETPEEAEDIIQRAVRDLLESFPPKQK